MKILLEISEENEATAFPWWVILDPRQNMRAEVGDLASQITGPFFSRAASYIRIHGRESWELDALDPRTVSDLIRKTVLKYRDKDLWDEMVDREEEHKATLRKAAEKMGRKS